MSRRALSWLIAFVVLRAGLPAFAQQAAPANPPPAPPSMQVLRTDDFTVDGKGSSAAWSKAEWHALSPRGNAERAHPARFKMLYSPTGLYVLMDSEDRILTATMNADFLHLWTEDVFEFFLWTDERYPVYFEYEISPLGYELPIIIPNFGGQFLGWRPWDYEGSRKIRKAVSVVGGPAKSGASITRWTAEVFVPYDLLRPLQNVPPKPGAKWRANVYRVDYDERPSTSWDWARVGRSFHEFEKFGTLVFE